MQTALFDDFVRYFAERYPHVAVADLEFVTSGWESDIYTFTYDSAEEGTQTLILRPYLGAGAAEKAAREGTGMRQLLCAGYSVPAILLYETDASILGRPFIIMEKLEGSSLWPVLAGAPASQASQLLVRFGSLLGRLHHLDWRPFVAQAQVVEDNPTSLLDALLNSFRQMYTRFGVDGFLKVLDWLQGHQSDIDVQPAVVHHDFHANNVLFCRDDHMAVIDWTQLAVSDARVDLSWTLMIMADCGQPEWREPILQGYRAAMGPVKNLAYFDVIAYTKLLASSVICWRDGPEKLGMRPQTVESLPGQAPVLEQLSRRVSEITGVDVPEVGALLRRIS